MTRLGFSLLTVVFLVTPYAGTAETKSTPDFKEVYKLVRQHLAGTTDAELNRAAVEGLIKSLDGKVTLVAGGNANAQAKAGRVSKSAAFDKEVAYVRVKQVGEGLAGEIASAIQELSKTNQLEGVALDLRFADGNDYAAVPPVTDLFVSESKPLLDWGDGVVKSKKASDAFKLPVAVLVNRETSGAAEALAAVLREAGVGLILGGTTAGRAMVTQDFPLENGQQLRIATAPVKLGDGKAISLKGVKPDIEVSVSLDRERAYFKNAYARLTKSNSAVGLTLSSTNGSGGTNRIARLPRTTEADLVRARREGISLDDEAIVERDTKPPAPLIHDPVLARAVDLLKGLAVMRQSQP